jgi:hypothetical protein
MVRVLTDFLQRRNRWRGARVGVVLALLVGSATLGVSGRAPAQTGDTSTTLDPALDTLPPYIEPTTTTRATVPPLAPTTTAPVSPFAASGDLGGVCASIVGKPYPGETVPASPSTASAAPAASSASNSVTVDSQALSSEQSSSTEATVLAGKAAPSACRLVAYYGNPTSPGLGPMGQSPAPQMLSALTALTQRWQDADPQTTTRCGLQLIAVVAQGSPGPGNLYRGRASAATINKVIGWGRERGCLTILDVQVGWGDVPTEVAYLERWLAMPDVHLALDPEWDMPPGAKPGSRIGTMSAADINSAIAVLDRLAITKGLGPRLLIVHRFRSFMVSDPQLIKPTPNIRLVVNMDGFGPVSEKRSSYVVAQRGMPTRLTGMKLFLKLDRPLLGPGEVISLKPSPVFINYQ